MEPPSLSVLWGPAWGTPPCPEALGAGDLGRQSLGSRLPAVPKRVSPLAFTSAALPFDF